MSDIEVITKEVDIVAGHLEVGINDRREVVVNLPHDMTGHIVFSPRQARKLAEALIRQASRAEADTMDWMDHDG